MEGSVAVLPVVEVGHISYDYPFYCTMVFPFEAVSVLEVVAGVTVASGVAAEVVATEEVSGVEVDSLLAEAAVQVAEDSEDEAEVLEVEVVAEVAEEVEVCWLIFFSLLETVKETKILRFSWW